jgi:hypothetical protein
LKPSKGEKISFNINLINFDSDSEVVVNLNSLKDFQIKGKEDDSLQTEINAAKVAIENALREDPEVTRAELGLEGATLFAALEFSHPSVDYIYSIRDTILQYIKAKRQEKKGGGGGDDLLSHRNSAITAINNELQTDPEVKITELETGNQNWENDIKNAANQNQIDAIKTRTLDDIKKKREDKNEEKEILKLLSRGKNQNTYSELAQTIQELKKMLSTKAYQRHQIEIDQLEAQLAILNPDKYKEDIRNDLNEQLKNNGLEGKKLEAETEKAIEEAIRDHTPSKKKIAEKAICQNGANEELKEILANSLQVKNKKEKEEKIAKILAFPNKNYYCEKSYQKFKLEVDKALAQLQNKKFGDNNSQNPSSPLKIFLSLALISLVILIILGIIL